MKTDLIYRNDDVEKDKNFEIRTMPLQEIEMRAQTDNPQKITGYAAVYDQWTEIADWWGDTFQERIAPGAMAETLADGHTILALRNHDWNEYFGKKDVNLTLEERQDGLYFECTPIDNAAGRDALAEVESGLVSGCSFGFRIKDQVWEEKDGAWFRTITKLDLYEITLTPIPAYAQTTAELRSLTPQTDKRNNQTAPKSGDVMSEEERQQLLVDVESSLKQFKQYM